MSRVAAGEAEGQHGAGGVPDEEGRGAVEQQFAGDCVAGVQVLAEGATRAAFPRDAEAEEVRHDQPRLTRQRIERLAEMPPRAVETV